MLVIGKRIRWAKVQILLSDQSSSVSELLSMAPLASYLSKVFVSCINLLHVKLMLRSSP